MINSNLIIAKNNLCMYRWVNWFVCGFHSYTCSFCLLSSLLTFLGKSRSKLKDQHTIFASQALIHPQSCWALKTKDLSIDPYQPLKINARLCAHILFNKATFFLNEVWYLIWLGWNEEPIVVFKMNKAMTPTMFKNISLSNFNEF